MNADDYQKLAIRTAKTYPSIGENLTHVALGLLTEAGEVGTTVKRHVIYNKELTQDMRQNLAEELGDLAWYMALACETLGLSLGDVLQENIEKLQARYPNAYSDQAAEGRADKGGLSATES